MAIVLYGIALVIFRKRKIPLFTDQLLTREEVYAPISGKVTGIQEGVDHPLFGKNQTVMQVRIGFFDNYGVYLPVSAEIKDVQKKLMKEANRFMTYKLESTEDEENGVLIQLNSKSAGTLGIQLVKCWFSMSPETVIAPGDRGKARANIGLMPFGGLALLYFDETYKVQSQIGDELNAGKSIISSVNPAIAATSAKA